MPRIFSLVAGAALGLTLSLGALFESPPAQAIEPSAAIWTLNTFIEGGVEYIEFYYMMMTEEGMVLVTTDAIAVGPAPAGAPAVAGAPIATIAVGIIAVAVVGTIAIDCSINNECIWEVVTFGDLSDPDFWNAYWGSPYNYNPTGPVTVMCNSDASLVWADCKDVYDPYVVVDGWFSDTTCEDVYAAGNMADPNYATCSSMIQQCVTSTTANCAMSDPMAGMPTNTGVVTTPTSPNIGPMMPNPTGTCTSAYGSMGWPRVHDGDPASCGGTCPSYEDFCDADGDGATDADKAGVGVTLCYPGMPCGTMYGGTPASCPC